MNISFLGLSNTDALINDNNKISYYCWQLKRRDRIDITYPQDGAVRSSHQRYSVKKGVLKNFTRFTGKHLCQGLFLNEVAG